MKKVFISFVVIFALVIVTTSANAQALYFFVQNNSGVEIHSVQVSPSEEENWGGNVLSEVFSNGMQIEVNIPEGYGNTCTFDMLVQDSDGNGLVFEAFDACALYRITLDDSEGNYSVQNEED